jgi:hypothetical protein
MSGAPQEAVLQEACVNVRSRDRPRRVDVRGEGEGGARGIDHGEGAVACPQEAVEPPACLLVESYDRPPPR